MVVFVILINIFISVICLYLAAKLWKISKQVNQAANAILRADRGTYNVLHNAPRAIGKGEKGTKNLRQQYQKLQNQLQTMRQLLLVLTFLSKFTRGVAIKSRL